MSRETECLRAATFGTKEVNPPETLANQKDITMMHQDKQVAKISFFFVKVWILMMFSLAGLQTNYIL
jgi:hypothetical protein